MRVLNIKNIKVIDFDNGVPIDFNPNYKIYPDGRCLSINFNKYLRKIKLRVKNSVHNSNEYIIYDTYDLRRFDLPNTPRRKVLVSRLVFYHFGCHNFKSFDDMNGFVVTYLDKNSENCHIDNLVIFPDYLLTHVRNCTVTYKGLKEQPKLRKIDNSYKPQIVRMLRSGMNYVEIKNEILKKFSINTTEMSVYRFCQRNNITHLNHKTRQYDKTTNENL